MIKKYGMKKLIALQPVMRGRNLEVHIKNVNPHAKALSMWLIRFFFSSSHVLYIR